ncbi:MAG TPA: FAD:protein FMN transferase [Pilimelia sp.]|nr:FAD:protein FMN transferase [Pilimelia sp.]
MTTLSKTGRRPGEPARTLPGTAGRTWVERVMGIPVSLVVRGPDVRSPATEAIAAEFFGHLRRVDAIFSTYRTDSQLSRWARGELALADADPSVREVLVLCELARQSTGGYFDARSLPHPLGPGTRFDPSGLLKGWAVQRAARHLADLDRHGWCVNAGGDVLVHAPAGDAPWRVGLEDPAHPGRLLRLVDARTGAVATSSTAHRGAHVVDPHTARPATGTRAVTVIGPSLLWADVYATAAAARGRGALAWLATIDGYEALRVDSDGTIDATAGWPAD